MLATNTWTDHFKIFTLVEIMRQHDEKEFCEALNRLRKAQCTQASHDLFQSCIVDRNATKYNPCVRHINPFRNAFNAFLRCCLLFVEKLKGTNPMQIPQTGFGQGGEKD